jgi:hypothetical protein
MFTATVRLAGEDTEVLECKRPQSRGTLRKVNDETRRKKLATLLALLKKQGKTPEVVYGTGRDGYAIAVITAH